MVRGLGVRVRRLRELHGWSLAELARRSGFGVGRLRRLEGLPARAYATRWYSGEIATLANVLGVTADALRGITTVGTPFGPTAPTETETQRVIRSLMDENEKLKRKRVVRAGNDLLKWATEQRLEIIQQGDEVAVIAEGEYLIAHGKTWEEALTTARTAGALATAGS
jgi:transcriptional regulator with XRE-family HTH domain